jgi:hypothetical protein
MNPFGSLNLNNHNLKGTMSMNIHRIYSKIKINFLTNNLTLFTKIYLLMEQTFFLISNPKV